MKIRNGYTANDGGGIWNEGLLTLTGCTIGGGDLEGNAAHSGGGIKNDVNAQVNVDSSTFSSNQATVGSPTDSGGGLFNLGAANLSNTTFNGNYAIIFGGAIYSTAGALLYLDQSTVNNNLGQFGSGISNAGTMHVTASTISGNYSDVMGGGIYNNGNLDVHTHHQRQWQQGCNNGDSGGSIYNRDVVMDTSIVNGNIRTTEGYLQWHSATLDLSTSTISGNGGQFTYSGGGIYNNGVCNWAPVP